MHAAASMQACGASNSKRCVRAQLHRRAGRKIATYLTIGRLRLGGICNQSRTTPEAGAVLRGRRDLIKVLARLHGPSCKRDWGFPNRGGAACQVRVLASDEEEAGATTVPCCKNEDEGGKPSTDRLMRERDVTNVTVPNNE